jgi:Tol biopolymer transport system component
MDADGTNVQQLTRFGSQDDAPVWSPDGKRIAFSSDRYGDREIFVMDADGTNVVRTNQKGSDPDWR